NRDRPAAGCALQQGLKIFLLGGYPLLRFGVSGGILPSGGSMIIEVRVPRESINTIFPCQMRVNPLYCPSNEPKNCCALWTRGRIHLSTRRIRRSERRPGEK